MGEAITEGSTASNPHKVSSFGIAQKPLQKLICQCFTDAVSDEAFHLCKGCLFRNDITKKWVNVANCDGVSQPFP